MAAHDHSHHDHSHHDHAHGDPLHSHVTTTNRTRLWITLVLILGFMVVEIVVGVLADSVALLADAGHMVIDAAAIALSLVALEYSTRPAGGRWTFGFRRVEILAAQINGFTLFVLAGGVIVESVRRLAAPGEVEGGWVLAVAAIGAVVNLLALWILSGADRRSLNIEGSFQHVLMDLFGSVAAIIAGAVILWTGFNRADAIAALAVAVLMLRSAWGLVGASSRVLMQAAPSGIDPDEVGRDMACLSGVVQVHDLHIWEVTSGFPTLSAHLVVARTADAQSVRRVVETRLRERYGIEHSTLQTDHEAPRLHTVARDDRPPKPDGQEV
jgi:cobalt-zinc-cadmium efflux system protein